MPAQDDDPTIRVVRRRPRRRLGRWLALIALLAFCVAAWMLFRPGSVPLPAELPSTVGSAIADADEAAILAAHPTALEVYRFRAAPQVLVLSFPALLQQGEMLDRIGAFVEKAGLPRERVLADAELDAAIRQSGDTKESYYYGHDYRAADMARFFAVADRDGVVLNTEEMRLRALLMQQGMLAPGAVSALITIPPETGASAIDAAARATILRHELSHGLYFTDKAYAAYALKFWETRLSDTQRAGFRGFLGNEGYDTANEDLMLNEAQAYLVHTADPRFFRPDVVGLSAAQAAALRQEFLNGMPKGWLKAAAEGAAP
jgi:uncharacterized tellurite resistance protein B-like protein